MNPPRLPLCCLPTPVHPLPRLSDRLGLDVWIKRDDLTGFAGGGNKGRKIEYLIAEALARGAHTVVTCGSTQSNFIRQMGAGCAVAGLRCVAVCMDLPYDGSAGKPTQPGVPSTGGNVTLDEWYGVELVRVPDGTWEQLAEATSATAAELGEGVYLCPLGGSTPLGVYAFYQAGLELEAQGPGFKRIVTATSSGSTQTGLAHAFRGTGTRVLGIQCDPEPEFVHDLAALSRAYASEFGGDPLPAEAFEAWLDWVGPGYNVPGDETREAVALLARTEGIVLDPVYTGKAFAGLVGLARQGVLTGRVLFWHTGGFPVVFAG